MRRKGFTLIELLVVIAIIALLASILMPTLKKAQELANRAKCIANLNGVGKGLKMYSDTYGGMPWLGSSDFFGTNVGTGRTTAPTGTDARSVTALPWLLVRTNFGTAEQYYCPSDKGAKVETSIRAADNSYYYDFSARDADNKFTISYSWQAPITDSSAKVVNGVNDDDSGVPILGDKTPSTSFNGPNAITGWASGITSADIPKYVSQNHSAGESVNFLKSSYDAGKSSRPDCGQNSDFIYGTSGVATGGSQWGVVGNTIASHLSTADSYLIGPKGS